MSEKEFNYALSLAINKKLKSLSKREVTGKTSNINAINEQLNVLLKLLDMNGVSVIQLVC